MNINVALEAIAAYLKIDSVSLKEFARADTIGGFDFNLANRKWPLGSIWGTEGQVLYALVRALQPERIAEIGHHHGCSASHMGAALQANNSQAVIECVDIVFYDDALPPTLEEYQRLVLSDGIAWLEAQPDNSVDFLFEDDAHSEEMTAAVWRLAQRKLAPGGVIVTHDSEHFLVGEVIRAGIRASGITDFLSLLADPSDCGLAVWQKPKLELPYFENGTGWVDMPPVTAVPHIPEIMTEEKPVKPRAKRGAKKAAK